MWPGKFEAFVLYTKMYSWEKEGVSKAEGYPRLTYNILPA